MAFADFERKNANKLKERIGEDVEEQMEEEQVEGVQDSPDLDEENSEGKDWFLEYKTHKSDNNTKKVGSIQPWITTVTFDLSIVAQSISLECHW